MRVLGWVLGWGGGLGGGRKAPLQGEGGSEPWEMAETQPLPSLPRPSWPTPTHLPLEEPFLGRGLRGAQIPVHTPLMGVGES